MGIPALIKCFFVVECVIFGPFALHHYLACANTKQLEHLSSNRVAWLVLHSGEMLHGVGALLVLFVVLNALIINEVSTIELEIILLAHSLWLSTIIAFWPLAKDAAILHIPLWCGAVWKSKFYGAFVLNHRVVLHAIDATPARWRGDAGSSPLDRARTDACGAVAVCFSYVESWSLVLDAFVIIYGRVKYKSDVYPNIISGGDYANDMARFREFCLGHDREDPKYTAV